MSSGAVLRVWRDTVRAGGRCRAPACRARIWWARTVERDALMPFTGDPVPLRTERDERTGRWFLVVEFEASHFRSCPAADQYSGHSRRRR